MLLHTAPSTKTRRDVLALATNDDRLAFGERELYWLPIGNMSTSELDLAPIGKTLGLTTTRAQRTMVRLAAKFLAG
jgi:hypothetical protein